MNGQLLARPRARIRRALLSIVFGMFVVLPVAPASTAEDFVVVVHPDTPITSIDQRELGKIFMKEKATWSDGQPILPVDLPSSSKTRKEFSRSVHGRSALAVKSYWQRLVFSGRGTPPPELKNEDAVLLYVGYKPGAIGYVSKGTELDGVRAIAIVED